MSRIMVTAFFQAKSPEARQEILNLLASIADHVWKNEPSTVRYCVCTPYEEDDGVSVYVIAEYADSAARAAHEESEPAKAFYFAVLANKDSTPLATDPVVYTDQVTLSTGEVSSYTRPEINEYPKGYIVMASVQYKPGMVSGALPGWKDIVTYCEANEPLALTYTILEDTKTDVLRTVEAYESKTYAREVHVPGPAVKANQQQNGHMRVGPNAMTVKRGLKYAGFMGRP